jgi:hypothetical protein
MHSYDETFKFVKEFGSKLVCTDFKEGSFVQISHDDGSFFLWKRAFAHNPKNDQRWLAVYTEHHGYHLYHEDDLSCMDSNDFRE